MTKTISRIASAVVVLVAASVLRAEPLRVCVVQLKEGFNDYQRAGRDARKLATELSERTLNDGTQVTAFPIVGLKTRDAHAATLRENCDYTVNLWRHDDPNVGTPGIDISNFPATPTGPIVPSHDKSTVDFTLSKGSSKRPVLRGIAPMGWQKIASYPDFASSILVKLNHS